MRLSIVVFDGLTTLDAVGGYEALARVPGMEVEWVAAARGAIAADTGALSLIATKRFDEVGTSDILYMPGGPGAFALERDEAFLDWLRRVDATSTWTVGVCNGVGVLAAAGLLRGHAATTNWFYRERLAGYGVEVVNARYHRSGKYVTGAGVSASIDTGLYLVNLIAGEPAAKAIQLGLEYYPSPPFPEKSPAEVAPELQELVRSYSERS